MKILKNYSNGGIAEGIAEKLEELKKLAIDNNWGKEEMESFMKALQSKEATFDEIKEIIIKHAPDKLNTRPGLEDVKPPKAAAGMLLAPIAKKMLVGQAVKKITGKKGAVIRKKRKAGKKGKLPLGAIIKGIWTTLPPGIKAGVIATGAGIVYSGARKILGRCKRTNTGKKVCPPRKINWDWRN